VQRLPQLDRGAFILRGSGGVAIIAFGEPTQS
jgi:hypothetical protein